MAEETLEKLDQEITLNLQKIDSNLSYCFNRITKQIIPHVTQYGTVCEEIMDHASWLGSMFQQTGSVDLSLQPGGGAARESADAEAGSVRATPETLFPLPAGGPPAAAHHQLAEHQASEDEFHTADAADSSDEAEGSTLQRRRRKRKVSLLLQQEFGSSSSMVPSPAAGAPGGRADSSATGAYRALLDSSPMKQPLQEDESTKQVPKPGTVIHFSTGA